MSRYGRSFAQWALILLSALGLMLSVAEAGPKEDAKAAKAKAAEGKKDKKSAKKGKKDKKGKKGKKAKEPEPEPELEIDPEAPLEEEVEPEPAPIMPEIPEALQELYPAAVFAELPSALLHSFSAEDFEAAAKACPADEGVEARHVVGCILASPKGQALSEAAFGQLVEIFGVGVAQQFPSGLALELSKDHLTEMREACPAAHPDEALSCLRQQPAFKIMAIKDQFGREIFDLMPLEVLVALPGVLTNYMTLDDFRLINKLCPQQELEGFVECLSSEKVEEALDPIITRRILSALLEDMDAELPRRFSDEDLDALAEGCDKPGEAWGTCVAEHGEGSAKCEASEDVLSACLLDNDITIGHFVEVQEDKKEAFGREVYVEMAGLLAGLTVKDIEALREACPEQNPSAFIDCAGEFAPIVETLGAFSQLSSMMAGEIVRQLSEAGVEGVKAEEYEARLFELFLTLPMPSIMSLSRDCEAENPKLAEITSVQIVEEMLTCIQDKSRKDPIANPLYVPRDKLEKWMEIGRAKVVKIIQDKDAAAQEKSTEYITLFLQAIALLGAIGILFMPLFLRKKHPGKMGLLWKASFVASFTFALTIILLGVALLVMRTVQVSVASEATNPKLRIADSLFDVLETDRQIDQFASLSEEGLDFIKTPLMELAEGDADPKEYATMIAYLGTHWSEVIQEPEIKHLVKNAEMLKTNVDAMKTLLGFYKKISWVMGYLPIILSFLAVLLYLLPMRQTLLDIAQAPARALEQGGEQKGIFKGAMSTVWAEFKLIWPFMLGVVLIVVLIGLCLTYTLVPFVESLIDHILLSIFYIAFTEASAFTLYVAIGLTILLLVLVLAVYIIAMSWTLGTFRKILRECFHAKRRSAAFNKFWFRAPIALIWALMIPVAFSVGFARFSETMVDKVDFASVASGDIMIVPIASFVAFPLIFVLLQGLRGLKFIKKYPVEPAQKAG